MSSGLAWAFPTGIAWLRIGSCHFCPGLLCLQLPPGAMRSFVAIFLGFGGHALDPPKLRSETANSLTISQMMPGQAYLRSIIQGTNQERGRRLAPTTPPWITIYRSSTPAEYGGLTVT